MHHAIGRPSIPMAGGDVIIQSVTTDRTLISHIAPYTHVDAAPPCCAAPTAAMQIMEVMEVSKIYIHRPLYVN